VVELFWHLSLALHRALGLQEKSFTLGAPCAWWPLQPCPSDDDEEVVVAEHAQHGELEHFVPASTERDAGEHHGEEILDLGGVDGSRLGVLLT
jgi:hypothetical protein